MKDNPNIAIVGAGPMGCYIAYLLARSGLRPTVFEEHKNIGEPIQCTGIVTKKIEQVRDIEEELKGSILNKANKIRVF